MKKVFSLLFLICSFLCASQVSAASPKEVVESFCKKDSQGARLSSDGNSSIQKLTLWEDEPGWDAATVIESYKVVSEKIQGEAAEVAVIYKVTGQAEGAKIKKMQKEEQIVYSLKLKNGKWKIEEPQPEPHVLKTSLKRRLQK